MKRYIVQIELPINLVVHAASDKEARAEAVRVAYEETTPDMLREAWALWAGRDDNAEIIDSEEVDSLWIVEEDTVCDGWTNTWSCLGKPQTFSSYAEALGELGDLFQTVADANKDGHMDSLYDPQAYRITEIMPSNTDEA